MGVCQRIFRQVMDGIGISIEAACFASPGVWEETRRITDVVDVRTGEKRKGPVKETLSWKQDRPCNSGPVEYEPWVLAVINPDSICAVEQTISETGADAQQLYKLWVLVCAHKHTLLWELNMLDKEALGYVSVADFHRALQLALEVNSSDAKLIVRNIPLKAQAGWVDSRRWLTAFIKDPRIEFESYMNISLLSSGTRESELRTAEAAIRGRK